MTKFNAMRFKHNIDPVLLFAISFTSFSNEEDKTNHGIVLNEDIPVVFAIILGILVNL